MYEKKGEISDLTVVKRGINMEVQLIETVQFEIFTPR